jgi:predicted lipoprotein with Yx(FWY)xxD motif
VKRLLILAVTGAVVVSALSVGLASAASSPARLSLRKTSVGTILVDNRGFTVYAFTRDARNQDSCLKIGGCVSVWPPLTTTGKPVAGRCEGLDARDDLDQRRRHAGDLRRAPALHLRR